MENFGPSNLEKKTVNKPSLIFSQQILPLKNKILSKFGEIEQTNSTKFTISEWLNFAKTFWLFSGNFEGLKEYQTLSQKREDQIAQAIIEEIVNREYIDGWKSSLKEKVDKRLDSIFKQYDGMVAIRFELLNKMTL